MLVYGDKIINLEHDPKEDMDDLNCTYILKDEIIGPPIIYLGYNFEKVKM